MYESGVSVYGVYSFHWSRMKYQWQTNYFWHKMITILFWYIRLFHLKEKSSSILSLLPILFIKQTMYIKYWYSQCLLSNQCLFSFVDFDQINARGQEFLWYLNIGMDSAKIRIRCGATSSKNSTDFYSFTYMFTNVNKTL